MTGRSFFLKTGFNLFTVRDSIQGLPARLEHGFGREHGEAGASAAALAEAERMDPVEAGHAGQVAGHDGMGARLAGRRVRAPGPHVRWAEHGHDWSAHGRGD